MGNKLPAQRPNVARLGQRCLTTQLDNGNDHEGVIVQMFEDTCVVRLDEPRDASEGDAPNVACVEWDDVFLCDVRPDPAELTRLINQDAPVKCIVRPGMRARIPVNDGNDDHDGIIIAVLPECAVLKLDKPRHHDNGQFAAADWDLVTMLDLAPGAEGIAS